MMKLFGFDISEVRSNFHANIFQDLGILELTNQPADSFIPLIWIVASILMEIPHLFGILSKILRKRSYSAQRSWKEINLVSNSDYKKRLLKISLVNL